MKCWLANVVGFQVGLVWAKLVGLPPICDLSWWAILVPTWVMVGLAVALIVLGVLLTAWSERNLL